MKLATVHELPLLSSLRRHSRSDCVILPVIQVHYALGVSSIVADTGHATPSNLLQRMLKTFGASHFAIIFKQLCALRDFQMPVATALETEEWINRCLPLD